MSALLLTRPALDMSDLAASYKPDVIDLAKLYAATNDKLGIYWLHVAAEDLKWQDRWQAVARGKLRDDFFIGCGANWPSRYCGAAGGTKFPRPWTAGWLRGAPKSERFKQLIEEMKLRPEIDFATLSVAAREFRDLIST